MQAWTAMDLSAVLGVIGSLASLGAIPLSIWFYLRSQEEKLASTRREILRVLSYQLGEGRALTLFEIGAVIDSHLRAKNLKPRVVNPRDIVDDLVAETIANPMLAPERKAAILAELERALLAPTLRQVIETHNLKAGDLLALVASRQDDTRQIGSGNGSTGGTPASTERAEAVHYAAQMQLLEMKLFRDAYQASERAHASSLFGIIAAAISIIAFFFQSSDQIPAIRDFFRKLPASELLVGAAAAVLAGLLTSFVNLVVRRPEKLQRSVVESGPADLSAGYTAQRSNETLQLTKRPDSPE